jgi:hypothetical protein
MAYPFVASLCTFAALAVSFFVCYNAARRQFNNNEPYFKIGSPGATA